MQGSTNKRQKGKTFLYKIAIIAVVLCGVFVAIAYRKTISNKNLMNLASNTNSGKVAEQSTATQTLPSREEKNEFGDIIVTKKFTQYDAEIQYPKYSTGYDSECDIPSGQKMAEMGFFEDQEDSRVYVSSLRYAKRIYDKSGSSIVSCTVEDNSLDLLKNGHNNGREPLSNQEYYDITWPRSFWVSFARINNQQSDLDNLVQLSQLKENGAPRPDCVYSGVADSNVAGGLPSILIADKNKKSDLESKCWMNYLYLSGYSADKKIAYISSGTQNGYFHSEYLPNENPQQRSIAPVVLIK